MAAVRKILMLTDHGFRQGGAEIMMHHLATELGSAGYEVRVLASSAGRERVPASEWIADDWCFGTESRLRGLVQSYNPWARRGLKRLLATFRPDLVHVHQFLTQLSPTVLDALREIPTVYTAHWYRAVCMTGFRMLPGGEPCRHRAGGSCLARRCVPLQDWPLLNMQLRRLATEINTIDRVVASSSSIAGQLLRGGLRVDRTILYGIPVARQRPALAGPPRLAFVARLVPGKGGRWLLHAFTQVVKQLPDARLDVYGDGPLRGELQSLTERLGLRKRVTFHGYVTPELLQPRLESAWVQAMPSRFEEPGGMVAYEAGMRGTAVVASNHGGFAESVQHGKTGYLAQPGDRDELARHLVRLLGDRSHCEEVGRAARAAMRERYTLERMVREYRELYEELLSRGRAGNA